MYSNFFKDPSLEARNVILLFPSNIVSLQLSRFAYTSTRNQLLYINTRCAVHAFSLLFLSYLCFILKFLLLYYQNCGKMSRMHVLRFFIAICSRRIRKNCLLDIFKNVEIKEINKKLEKICIKCGHYSNC